MTDVIVGFDVRACVHVDVEHGHITRVAIDTVPNDHPHHLGGPRDRYEAAIALCDDPGLIWPQPEARIVRRGRPGSGGPIERFSGDYAFLSNFHPSTVAFDEALYPTLEHAFQAAKSTSRRERQEIREAPTPARAKRLGRRVALGGDWEARRVGVMRALLVDKFTRHPELAARLAATAPRRLVEGNDWGDRFWGVCDGRGLNQLGRLLMAVRDQLAAGPGGAR
ncbi:MAG: NADAR family protein [Solirubrobacteraceae bacterium MAG38_C4-C5]|nr:NADAR family protein [Candidatus Siliceabacter maunaloa]